MRRNTLIVLAATALGLAVPAVASAASPLSTPETVKVDTFAPPPNPLVQPEFTAPQSTTGFLQTGHFYLASVTGTWSAFIPQYMSSSTAKPPDHFITCGTAEPHPAEASPGRPDSPVGQDAEIIFARPERGNCSKLPVPVAYQGFQIDDGDGTGFNHITAVGGPFTTPQAGHNYKYILSGHGAVASFRIRDYSLADNTGILTVVVSDCGTDPTCTGQTNAPSLTPPPLVTGKSSTCLSRRKFVIRIVTHRANPVQRATVKINKGRVHALRLSKPHKGRLTAIIDLRGVKRATATVRIVATLRNGAKRVGIRRYHTCVNRRLLTVTIRPRRDRTSPFSYTVSGVLHRSPGIKASACTRGPVSVRAFAGRRTFASRRVRLNSSCRFTTRLSFTSAGKLPRNLTITARFLGNKHLKPARSWPATVRAG